MTGRPPRPGTHPPSRTARPKNKVNDDDCGPTRTSTVYRVVERILEGDINSREELVQLLQPFSGLEFLQAAEERSLSGMCGSPLCQNSIPQRSVLHTFLQRDEQGQQPACVFCSPTCELQGRRLASSLGDEQAANARFTQQQLRPKGKRSKSVSNGQTSLAAGDKKTPVMLQSVQEREAECNGSNDITPASAWNSVDGFIPSLVPQLPQANRHGTQEAAQSPQLVQKPPKSVKGSLSWQPRDQSAAGNQQAGGSTLEELTESIDALNLETREYGDERKNEVRESDSEDDEVERMAKEPQDSSDEASQASDLDPLEDAHIPWMDEEAMGQQVELSSYGALHQALEGLITDSAVAFCLGKDVPPPCSLQIDQHVQVLNLLKAKISQAMGRILQYELKVPALLAQAGPPLFQLVKRFNLSAPVPSLQGMGWEILTAAMLMSLSMHVHPDLRPAFESRESQDRVSSLCSKRGLELAHLIGLCELLTEGQ